MEHPIDETSPTEKEAAAPTALLTAPRVERERGEQVILEEFGSQEEFEKALEATIQDFGDGDIVDGVVVKIDPEEVLLDIGYKSEGVIPSRELSIKHDIDPNDVVRVGDVIEALVLQKEDKEGRLILSKKRAQYERAWGKIEEIHGSDSTVTGTVIEVVKGGLILDIGLRGFLPASLVEMRRVRDLHPYVGRELEAKVIELDKNRNNVVLSRRKFLEETQSEFRREFLETLEKGEIRKGTVSSCVNFGAFVDLGGVDGLVHVSELSWKHVDHPQEVVEVGDEVEVEVLDVDLERERVSLSLKATQEDPWRQFARQHYVGEFIEGRVTKLVPFGVFVKVEEGIEGLVHISELAEAHVEVPEQVVRVNDPITVKIIDIDDARRRISLSLKQAVKAGYGEEPEITEEPQAESSAAPPAEAVASGAVGAALEAALQQRTDDGGEAETSGGVSLGDVIADLREQAGTTGEAPEEAPAEVVDEGSPAEPDTSEGDAGAEAALEKIADSQAVQAEAEAPDGAEPQAADQAETEAADQAETEAADQAETEAADQADAETVDEASAEAPDQADAEPVAESAQAEPEAAAETDEDQTTDEAAQSAEAQTADESDETT